MALVAIFGLEAAVGVVAGFLRTVLEAPAGVTGEAAARAVSSQSGLLFSLFGLVAIGVMLSPLAAKVDRQGPFRVCLAGLVSVAGALGLLWSGSGVWVWAAMIFYGVGYGLIFPAAAGAIALATSKEDRGRGNGLFNFFFDLGLSTGPVVAGIFAITSSVSPFVTGLVLVGLVTTLLVFCGAREREFAT
jgi:MFS family permease